jgi:hypothetical protein
MKFGQLSYTVHVNLVGVLPDEHATYNTAQNSVPFQFQRFFFFSRGNLVDFVCSEILSDTENIVACRPVAGQRPQDKQIYNSRYYVTASQTSVFGNNWIQQ